MPIVKKFTIVLSGVLLASSMFAGIASAQKVTLKMAHWVPPVHHLTQTYAAWAATVRAASG